MDRQNEDEKETTQAWFVVTDPGDTEHFEAIDGLEETVGAGIQQTAPPKPAQCTGEESENSPEVRNTEVEPERSALVSKVESPTGLSPMQFEERVEPKGISPEPDKSDAIRVIGVSAELLESAPAPNARPTDDVSPIGEMERLSGPVRAEEIEIAAGTESPIRGIPLPQVSAPSSQFGFTQSELIRIGGNRPLVPSGVVGLIVTARTPQRVRLGQVTVLHCPRTVIGRGRVNLLVDDPGIANLHAVITFERGEHLTGFRLYAHDSAPVTVNGTSVGELVPLANGDRIAIGSTELVFLTVTLCSGGAT